MHNQIELSIPLQLRLSQSYGLSAEVHSNTRPYSCKGETGRQDEERNTDTNLNCKKSEDAVKGGDVSQEERKRGWRLVSTPSLQLANQQKRMPTTLVY